MPSIRVVREPAAILPPSSGLWPSIPFVRWLALTGVIYATHARLCIASLPIRRLRTCREDRWLQIHGQRTHLSSISMATPCPGSVLWWLSWRRLLKVLSTVCSLSPGRVSDCGPGEIVSWWWKTVPPVRNQVVSDNRRIVPSHRNWRTNRPELTPTCKNRSTLKHHSALIRRGTST